MSLLKCRLGNLPASPISSATILFLSKSFTGRKGGRKGGTEGGKERKREGEGWGREGKRKSRRGRLRFKTNTPKGQMQPVSQRKESPPHGTSTWKLSRDQRDGPLCHWSHSMSAVSLPPLLTSKTRLIHLNTLLCVPLDQEVICFKCSCMGM